MRTETVETEILLGLQAGERPADLLYLCHAAALMRLAFGKGPEELEEELSYHRLRRSPLPFDFGSFEQGRKTNLYARLFRGVGVILCPIFEDLKHRQYQEYSSAMRETRLSYVGIATNHDIKAEYSRKVEMAINVGAFETLSDAQQFQLPQLLRAETFRDGDAPLTAA